jgi:hypothetical protein
VVPNAAAKGFVGIGENPLKAIIGIPETPQEEDQTLVAF